MSRRQLLFLLVGIHLVLLILACGGTGDPAAIVEHLPTLTRTPLPTLTPTANATQVALAPSTETTVSAPDSASSSVETERLIAGNNSGVEPILPDSSTNGAPLAPTDSVVTNPNAPSEALPPANSPAPTETPTPLPTNTSLPTATDVPPTPTETPTPSPTPLPAGWVFAGVKLVPAADGGDLLVHGNLVNNTGITQRLDLITGLFYDEQGQVIANANYTDDYYPVTEVPQGSRIPFEIVVVGRANAANFDLNVLAEPGGDAPRQDFEFLAVNPVSQGEEFCVAGQVRNPGGQLNVYLVVAAVLYDSEDKVINYYDHYEDSPRDLVGEQTKDVSICVDPLNQEVARYELQGWGL